MNDNIKTKEDIIEDAEFLCKIFVNKVESGKARSVETYHMCKNLLDKISKMKESKNT